VGFSVQLHQTALAFLAGSSVVKLGNQRVKTLSRNLRLISVQAEIQISHLLNTSWKLYCLSHLDW
jgi:hypothetical protein